MKILHIPAFIKCIAIKKSGEQTYIDKYRGVVHKRLQKIISKQRFDLLKIWGKKEYIYKMDILTISDTVITVSEIIIKTYRTS